MDILDQKSGENWTAYNGDCIPLTEKMPDNSVGHIIYSPPFSNLFVYSESDRDMGNCASDDEFMEQYAFLSQHLFRILQPGRIMAVHCVDIPATQSHNGYIGFRPFSNMLIDRHLADGFVYHSRVTIWKDPVVEMQRTKALGLLYKQLRKDSCRSRVGNPDYLLIFRKPGDNENPVTHEASDFPVDMWQQWASPVWMDIQQTNVLGNFRNAKGQNDEKHICPLQLDVIERSVIMWSNPGDVVYSPFMGIGSEGYVAVKNGRKFIGAELKPEYFRQACGNLNEAEREKGTLFNQILEAAE